MNDLKPEETANATESGEKARGNGKKALKVILIIVCAVLALAVIAGVGVYAYYRHVFSKISLPETVESMVDPADESFDTESGNEPWLGPDDGDDTTPGGDGDDTTPGDGQTQTDPEGTTVEVRDPDDIEWPDDLVPLGDDGLINIMLVGQDNSNFSKRGRSDSMILVSVNPKTGEVSMVSFLRDLYVQIGSGYSDNRLNVAYKYGGFPLMFDVFKRNFGITCDYGVVVNFDSFKSIIDTLGGVDLTFTQKEVDYLINKCGVGKMPDGTMIKAGLNKKVPSDTALAYARIRKIDSDFSRTARQRKLILSVYESLKGSSLSTILDLLGQITDFVRVYGMNSNELISLVTKLYPLMGNEIKSSVVPSKGEYTYASIRGMSVIVPDLPKIRENLKTKLPLES